ncbi:MAG: AAA family ATPase, partial [Victivallaceae bacterium]
MIEYLKINNLALIESAEVEFDAGFNVISGESGAGKSILISGIAILCGERCDRSIIRQGSDKCSLAMHINCESAGDELFTLLGNSGIDLDEGKTLCVRRVITRTQSRNFINESPVTQQFLREVMSFLVDRHNANEHMSLTDRRRQLELLDRYGNLAAEKTRCQMLCRELAQLRRERDEFLRNIPSVLEAQHYLMVAEEIRKVNPAPDEDEELKQRHNLASNAKSILDSSAQAVTALRDSDSSILNQMGEIYRIATDLA